MRLTCFQSDPSYKRPKIEELIKSTMKKQKELKKQKEMNEMHKKVIKNEIKKKLEQVSDYRVSDWF